MLGCGSVHWFLENVLTCPLIHLVSLLFSGEAIPIYAEIENCSSRLVVPKAAIFQTQTYLASGKTKTVRHMVANVRGNHIGSGTTDTWNGKMLKIPPVTPSILDCCIIRVDYSLAVSKASWITKQTWNRTVSHRIANFVSTYYINTWGNVSIPTICGYWRWAFTVTKKSLST